MCENHQFSLKMYFLVKRFMFWKDWSQLHYLADMNLFTFLGKNRLLKHLKSIVHENNVNISFYLIQTFGGNIWPSNYCWSHHKVGHFCPKMRLKETGRNLGRIWQMKFHLQARFSIEIHFYFQTLRLKNSTFCLLLRKSKKFARVQGYWR